MVQEAFLSRTSVKVSKSFYTYQNHKMTFIFSIVAEELGFIGCFAIIALFAVLIWRGILTAMRAPDNFGSLLAVGITTLIGIQVIINIAVVTGINSCYRYGITIF